MILNSIRHVDYESHIVADEASFLHDVALWQGALTTGTPIHHHVTQFYQFCEAAIRCLNQAHPPVPSSVPEKKLAYRSRIAGTLAAQWILLRQLAEQRVTGNPYATRLNDLDQLAARYYSRVCQAIGTIKVSQSPPMAYLGNTANLTIINADMPSILGVPFGAADPTNVVSRVLSEQTIPHEIAHAVVNQIADVLPELEFKLRQRIKSAATSGQARVVQSAIANWLNEILADLIGVALGGIDFASSAIQITIMPDEVIEISKVTHPVGMIRPYIHLRALKFLQANATALAALETKMDQVIAGYLDRTYSLPNSLTVVTFTTLRDEMLNLIDQFLLGANAIKLDSLGGMTIGELIAKCHHATASVPAIPNPLPNWGQIPDCADFVLRIAKPLGPEHSTPSVSPYIFCCWVGWTACC